MITPVQQLVWLDLYFFIVFHVNELPVDGARGPRFWEYGLIVALNLCQTDEMKTADLSKISTHELNNEESH